MSGQLSWAEASVIGLLQGVSELFPVSSLGHSVLIPAIVGGSWQRDLNVRSPESPYLAFIVGLHVATAVALIIFFWRDWVRIVRGLGRSIRRRRVETADERLAWLLILATIPVGISGLLLEHTFRTVLARPTVTACFLVANGVILLVADRWRRAHARDSSPASADLERTAAQPPTLATPGSQLTRASATQATTETAQAVSLDENIARLHTVRAVAIGSAQIAALAPGISRSGVTMAAGLRGGLDHETAARFSFLLATPVILAAGALKIPDLTGPLGDGIRGQVVLGSVLSGVGAYLSVRFLSRYFRAHSLRPFGWYCIVTGLVAAVLVNR